MVSWVVRLSMVLRWQQAHAKHGDSHGHGGHGNSGGGGGGGTPILLFVVLSLHGVVEGESQYSPYPSIDLDMSSASISHARSVQSV